MYGPAKNWQGGQVMRKGKGRETSTFLCGKKSGQVQVGRDQDDQSGSCASKSPWDGRRLDLEVN